MVCTRIAQKKPPRERARLTGPSGQRLKSNLERVESGMRCDDANTQRCLAQCAACAAASGRSILTHVARLMTKFGFIHESKGVRSAIQ